MQRPGPSFSWWEGWGLSRFCYYFSSGALVGRMLALWFEFLQWVLVPGVGGAAGVKGGSRGCTSPHWARRGCGMNVGVGGGPAQARTEWLSDPPADGSNFWSRGAGLSCRPARQGPKPVPRKPPAATCSRPDAVFVFVYLKMLELGDSLSEDGAEADAFGALLGEAHHCASCAPCLSLAWGWGWAAGPRGSPCPRLGARPQFCESAK